MLPAAAAAAELGGILGENGKHCSYDLGSSSAFITADLTS